MNDLEEDIHEISLDKDHIEETKERYRSNTPSRMEFINFKKEFKKTELLEKAREEAKTLKYKEQVVKEHITPEGIWQHHSNEHRPTEKIDNMDYQQISLDTIAKIPNTCKGGHGMQAKLLEGASEADRELLLGIMQDSMYENDQIQSMMRLVPQSYKNKNRKKSSG